MRKFGLISGFVIAMLVLSAVCSNVDAQAGGPGSGFHWESFTGKDGKTQFKTPRWTSDKLTPNSAYILYAKAKYQLTAGRTFDKANLKVYKSGAVPMSYEATPTIELDAVPGAALQSNYIRDLGFVPNTNNMTKQYAIEWNSPIAAAATVPNNSSVKLEVTVTTTTLAGVTNVDILTPPTIVTVVINP